MKVKPRIFRYKRMQKNRSVKTFKSNPKILNGSSGLLLLQSIRFTANQLGAFKLFLKRATRKFDRTRRFFWFNGFPQLPLTQKPTGSRMGKGKGKVQCWFIKTRPGTFLFEFINLRNGRARYFMTQMGFKLNGLTRICFVNSRFISCPWYSNKKARLNFFDIHF